MFFSNRRRVEEDLERIKKANLPDSPESTDGNKAVDTEQKSERLRLEKGDLTAMIIAAFTVLGPFVLIFIGVVSVIVFLLRLAMG